MSTLPIPFAEQAEADLVGTVAATRLGAHINADRVTADDFYQPACARAFEVAKDLQVVDQDERLERVSREAEVDPAWLRSCVDERPTMHDLDGAHARAVKEAAERRQLMRWAADVHRAAALGDEDTLRELGAPNAA